MPSISSPSVHGMESVRVCGETSDHLAGSRRFV
jgi:hypothetical protein